MKIITIILLTCLTTIICTRGISQDVPSLKYRVVAINSGDSSIHSISNELELFLPLKIYLPTAFSPNGDGLNDTFGAVGEGIEDYKLIVYNRWGEVIFSSHELSDKWDGLYKGIPVPFGTYNYEVRARGSESGKIHKTGHVTLLN